MTRSQHARPISHHHKKADETAEAIKFRPDNTPMGTEVSPLVHFTKR